MPSPHVSPKPPQETRVKHNSITCSLAGAMDGEHINQAVFGSLKMYSPLPRSSLPAQGGRLLFKHQSLRPVSWGALPHLSCHGERKKGGGEKETPDEEVFDDMVGAERMKGLLSWNRDPLGSQGFGEIWHREFG